MSKKKTKGNAPRQAGKKKAPEFKNRDNARNINKLLCVITDRLAAVDKKRLLTVNAPYIIVFYLVDRLAWLYCHCAGGSFAEKAGVLFINFQMAFATPVPSIHPYDLMAGMIGAAAVKAAVYLKGKNAKKYRQGVEYGSARWGA